MPVCLSAAPIMEDVMNGKRMLRHVRSLFAVTALLSAVPASAATVISEVLYDAGGTNNGNVFMELFDTPGIVPASTVPVSPAAVLFLSGIAGLLGVSRRE
jgi:hypothetical protein